MIFFHFIKTVKDKYLKTKKIMLNEILTKNEIKKVNCMEKSQNQLADYLTKSGISSKQTLNTSKRKSIEFLSKRFLLIIIKKS